jgi:hypothetical protein
MRTVTAAEVRRIFTARNNESADPRVFAAMKAENRVTRHGGDHQDACRYAAICQRGEDAYTRSVKAWLAYLAARTPAPGPQVVTAGMYAIHGEYYGPSR